jgi:tRNA(Ile)-lysidine synthase TilS/MesJ
VFTRRFRSLTHTTTSAEHQCRGCFIAHVEGRTFEAIERYEMVRPGDRVLACVSGEKDSTVMFHLLHKWIQNNNVPVELVMFTADEGMSDYRTRCVELARRHAEARGVRFITRAYAVQFGTTLDRIHAERPPDGPRICGYCCSLRGHTLRDVAKEFPADVIATGTNLSDGAEYALQCLLMGKFDEHGLPAFYPGGGSVRFVAPLCQLTGVEIALYGRLAGVEVISEDCVYCGEHLRDDLRDALNLVEDRNPGIVAQFYASYQRLAGMRERMEVTT